MSSMPATASVPDRVPECSLIVPVFRNEANIPQLLERFQQLQGFAAGGVEIICVIDGSPDRCYELLNHGLSHAHYPARLLLLSRNFGSFAAIRVGLKAASGRYYAVMAADLQEPAELIIESFAALKRDECDVVLGTRNARDDPWLARIASSLFWRLYRAFIQRELPTGGVDIFACNRIFRDQLLTFQESHTSLVGQLIWLGFRRKYIPYTRQRRQHGESAWGFRRKWQYFLDSVYSFSDLPIKIFVGLGAIGVAASVAMGLIVLAARLMGEIVVPGYAATVIAIVFFSGLNLFGLGIIGSYVWRAYENTKSRPLAVVMREQQFAPGQSSTTESKSEL